jgi:hypothetical protein
MMIVHLIIITDRSGCPPSASLAFGLVEAPLQEDLRLEVASRLELAFVVGQEGKGFWFGLAQELVPHHQLRS